MFSKLKNLLKTYRDVQGKRLNYFINQNEGEKKSKKYIQEIKKKDC